MSAKVRSSLRSGRSAPGRELPSPRGRGRGARGVPAGRADTKLKCPLLDQFKVAAPKVAERLPFAGRARAWQEALLRAFVLAFPKTMPQLLQGSIRDRHGAVALAGVGALLRECAGDAEAKQLSGRLRQYSVSAFASRIPILRGCLSLSGFSDPRARQVLFQLSRFGRAGPTSLRSAVESALEQHRVDTTRVFPASGRLRRSLMRFAARWANGRTGVGRASYSAKAGFEVKASAGGWREEVRRLTTEFRDTPLTVTDAYQLGALVSDWCRPYVVWSGRNGPGLVWQPGEEPRVRDTVPASECLFLWEKDYADTISLTLDTWELQREHLFALAACLWQVKKNGVLGGTRPPKARRVVVRERGAKTRVVTPIESCVAFLGVYLNAWLLGMLTSDPRVDPFEEPKGPEWVVPPGASIRSTDLQRASDLIPGWVAEAIARGLVRGQGLRHSSVEQALLLFCRPFSVEGEGDPWLTNGCPLMGAGPTWPLLCIYNLWLGTRAFGNEFVRVVGDDLLGLGNQGQSIVYNRLLGQTGGSVSVAKDTFSPYAGCLVERLCVVESGRLKWYDTISVGSLAGVGRVDRGGEDLPRWARGPGLKWAPGVDYLMETTFAQEFATLRRFGLNPYIPREFGGPGFPCSPQVLISTLKSLRPHWARALRCVMAQGVRGYTLLSRLQRPWQSRSQRAPMEATAWAEEMLSQYGEGRELIGASQAPKVTSREFMRMVEGGFAAAFGLAQGFEQGRSWDLHLASVIDDLRRQLVDLNQLVPKRRLTDKPRNLEKGLRDFLERSRTVAFVLPAELRVSYGFGAARVGPAVG